MVIFRFYQYNCVVSPFRFPLIFSIPLIKSWSTNYFFKEIYVDCLKSNRISSHHFKWNETLFIWNTCSSFDFWSLKFIWPVQNFIYSIAYQITEKLLCHQKFTNPFKIVQKVIPWQVLRQKIDRRSPSDDNLRE